MNKRQLYVTFSTKLLVVFAVVFFLGGFVFAPKTSKTANTFAYPTLQEATPPADEEQKASKELTTHETHFNRVIAATYLVGFFNLAVIYLRSTDAITEELCNGFLVSGVALFGCLLYATLKHCHQKSGVRSWKEWTLTYAPLALTSIFALYNTYEPLPGLSDANKVCAAFALLTIAYSIFLLTLTATRKLPDLHAVVGLALAAGVAFNNASQILTDEVVSLQEVSQVVHPLKCALIGFTLVLLFNLYHLQNLLERSDLYTVSKEKNWLADFSKIPYLDYLHFAYYPCLGGIVYGSGFNNTQQAKWLVVGLWVSYSIITNLPFIKWNTLLSHGTTQLPFVVALYWEVGCYLAIFQRMDNDTDAPYRLLNTTGWIVLCGTIIYFCALWNRGKRQPALWTALLSGIFGGIMVNSFVDPASNLISISLLRAIIPSLVGTCAVFYAQDLFEACYILWHQSKQYRYVPSKLIEGLLRNFRPVIAFILTPILYTVGYGSYHFAWGINWYLIYVHLIIFGGVWLLLKTIAWHPRRWLHSHPPKISGGYLTLTPPSSLCYYITGIFVLVLIFVEEPEESLRHATWIFLCSYLIDVYHVEVLRWLERQMPSSKGNHQVWF